MSKLLIILLLTTSLFADERLLTNISIGGSTTIYPLSVRQIEKYKKITNNKVLFANTQSSSSKGIRDLLNEDIDIARSSRNLKPSEVNAFAKKNRIINSFHIAYDAIGIVVHPQLAREIKFVTKENLKKIFFTGEITNWSAINPKVNKKINIYIRKNEHDSGTSEVFKRWFGYDNDHHYTENSLYQDSIIDVMEKLKKDQYGISILSFSHAVAEGFELIPIKLKNGNVVECNKHNIRLEEYPLSRGLYYIVEYPLSLKIAKFFNYILGEEGQKIIREQNYIPSDDEEDFNGKE